MIYIVEDDAAIRELEQYALQSSGHDVQSFESSESFWQAMNVAVPELVILDVMLPGEDGFSILKKLRAAPSLRRLPIIMITAKSSELDTSTKESEQFQRRLNRYRERYLFPDENVTETEDKQA